MMVKLPVVRCRELVRALERDGWYIERTRGHHLMRHPKRPGVVIVPNHSGDTIPPRTLRSIFSRPHP